MGIQGSLSESYRHALKPEIKASKLMLKILTRSSSWPVLNQEMPSHILFRLQVENEGEIPSSFLAIQGLFAFRKTSASPTE